MKKKKITQKKSATEILYQEARKSIRKLVISQENSTDIYAVVRKYNHLESFSLRSTEAINWLRTLVKKKGIIKVQHESVCKNVLATLAAEASSQNLVKKIYHRVAFEKESIYYDLVNPDWSIVRINEKGVNIVPMDGSSPLFRRTQSSRKQTLPKFDDEAALKKLTKLLRIKDEQIFQVHLATMFLEHVPIPIMGFLGKAGFLKSTTSALVKLLVDPSGFDTADNLSSMPVKDDDMRIQLYKRYLTAYDNVSKITQSKSDILCTAITGGGNDRRALYTDMDEVILNYRRKIIINGVAPNLDFPDLLDRLIIYDRIPIENGQRLTDVIVKQKFQKLLPKVLGNIFSILSKAIRIYKEIQMEIKPRTRLADFEVWGEAISRALGYQPNTFLEKFYERIRTQSAENSESHPLLRTIEKLLEVEAQWYGSATELFEILRNIGIRLGIKVDSPRENFPKISSGLTRELTKLSPLLEKLGIDLERFPYTKNDGKYSKGTSMIWLSKESGEDGEGYLLSSEKE